MRKLITGCGLLLLAALPCTAAQKPRSSLDERQAVTQLEHRWLLSLDDPTALERILADDFVHVLPMGFITKQEQIDYLKSHPHASSENRHFEGLQVRIYGNTAVVNGVVVAKGANGTRRTLFTDVFVKRAGQWQAVNAQETPEAVPAH